jgi:hypothetical protein
MSNLFVEIKDRKVILSTLWIFAVLNYIYADVITLMNPERLQEFMTGLVGGLTITPVFLFIGSILMETAIVMVLFSRILKYKWNRITNIISGLIHTLAVFGSMFVGTLELYYAFFATIEIATTLFIIWYAWTWPNPED